VFFESPEKCRKAGAAAESDDAATAVRSFRFERGLFHGRMASNDDTSLYRKEFNTESTENAENTKETEKTNRLLRGGAEK